TYLAAFGALLIVTSPLYYPEVRISFADSLQILYLSLAGVFFERFFRRGQRKRDLFVGFLLLFGCANQMFYFCWVIAGLLAVGTILYPRMTLRCFCPLPRSVTVLLALMLGLANFVIYNVSQGFPTFAELIKRRFHPAATNTVAGDGHLLDMFANDLGRKLYQLPRYFDAPQLYTIIYGLVLLVTVVFAVHLMKRGRLWAKRICFAPGLATLVILFLILISPSTTRVGHYVYIVPFLQLSALAALLGLGQMFTARPFARRMTVFLLAGALVTVNFVQSNRVISATNRSGGRHLFSPAIFDFVRYLNEHSIDSQDVLFTVWGLHLQPYFLNRGQFRIRQVVYQLILRKTAAEREAYLEHLFSSYHGLPVQGDALYLPVTAGICPAANRADSLRAVAGESSHLALWPPARGCRERGRPADVVHRDGPDSYDTSRPGWSAPGHDLRRGPLHGTGTTPRARHTRAALPLSLQSDRPGTFIGGRTGGQMNQADSRGMDGARIVDCCQDSVESVSHEALEEPRALPPHVAGRRQWLMAVALFCLVTVAYTYPLILQARQATLQLGLNYVVMANAKVIGDQLSTGSSPLQTDRILAPAGYTIHEGFLPSLMVYALGLGRDFLVGLNLSLLISFVLASLGAWALAFTLTGSNIGATAAGLFFGFCAMHYANYPLYPIVHIEWIPWHLYAHVRYLGSGRRRFLALAALSLIAASLSSWYFTVFLLLTG
ncbi:MAG: hypothetical protein P8Y94_16090, partial [Acidobacteriota bacterium]